jgi:hypothetical protein
MPPPPIILIHRGDSYYLAHTIAQARSSNPESRLILLGDRSNSFYLGVEHHRYEDYFEDAREFAKLFTYEYFPTYQYPWILFCHQKYFALRDFVRSQGIDKFVLIDSDVLIYEPVGPYFDYYRDYRITLSASSFRCAQAAFAVVNDPVVIDDLCRVYSKLFESSPEKLNKRFGTNCFTEMLGLGLLMRDPANRVRNTYEETESFFIHHNLLDDSRFEKDGEYSRTFWQESTPMFRERSTGRLLKTPIIHFHGYTKKQMGKNLRLKSSREYLVQTINRGISAVAKYPMRVTNTISRRAIFPGI